jgi:anaerobic magnesium-protoporphyrin IX monomethyl ester cyclase
MKKPYVVFIAKKEYDNLGIGYMAAVLQEAGFKTKLIDINDKKKKILNALNKLNPLVVGFSVIYQYYIDQFTNLIDFLRKTGFQCHFTAGGHYASLKYEELLKLAPGLDSIVRFEGEYTILELAKCIHSGQNWRKAENIVYVRESKIIVNPLRPPEKNLDRLPFPVRLDFIQYAFDKKFTTLLAGRGCLYDCSFCNMKEFYLPFKGPLRRTRKPEMVVREMECLFRKKGCSVFLFQDDDFPVKSENGSEWIERFCNEIKCRGLSDKIMWKINCRPDEVDEKSFEMMKSNGLFLVFIGIEDGTDSGLKRLNKHMSVSRSLAGINTLKKLEISFDFGFMLFQPSTTFISLNENLDFLEKICGDGYTPLTFIKLMPFYETRIEKELIAEGRLKSEPGNLDYDFLEDWMNPYFEFITICFLKWIRYPDGVYNISKWARDYISAFIHSYGMTKEINIISKEINEITSESNHFLLETLKELASIFESGKYNNGNYDELKSWKKKIRCKQEHYKKKIKNAMFAMLAQFERHKYLQPLLY